MSKKTLSLLLCTAILVVFTLFYTNQKEKATKENPEPEKTAETDDLKEAEIPETANEEIPFSQEPLSEELKERITGISYVDNDHITYDDLCYLKLKHYDFDGNVKNGEMICNKQIADDLLYIFSELYEAEYPIAKMILIDAYDGDDQKSMEDNNSSCFNYRKINGTDKISKHGYGMAVDINPLYNPYLKTSNGIQKVEPVSALPYTDRTAEFDGKIDTEDLCYQLFTERGFTWGGNWNSVKDYQHFEKE